MSQFAGSIGAAPRPAPSPHDMRRVQSTGHLTSGMKRVPSAPAMRRPPSSGRLAEHGEEARGRERATHSRNSGGGSELFDALLLAATGARGAALCCAALCVHAAGGLTARDALEAPQLDSGLAGSAGRSRWEVQRTSCYTSTLHNKRENRFSAPNMCLHPAACRGPSGGAGVAGRAARHLAALPHGAAGAAAQRPGLAVGGGGLPAECH